MKKSVVSRQRVTTILDKLLKRSKLSRNDVCVHLRITPIHLMRICDDYRTNLTINNLYKLSSLLDLSATQLLYSLERYSAFKLTKDDKQAIEIDHAIKHSYILEKIGEREPIDLKKQA